MKPIPRMLSPKAHSILDFVMAGSFLASVGWFWPRSKRAAIAALICGTAELAVSLLTDYPGGIKKVITFRAHRDIDIGLAAMTAELLEFAENFVDVAGILAQDAALEEQRVRLAGAVPHFSQSINPLIGIYPNDGTGKGNPFQGSHA